jgi:hypothetical protein
LQFKILLTSCPSCFFINLLKGLDFSTSSDFDANCQIFVISMITMEIINVSMCTLPGVAAESRNNKKRKKE